MYNWIWFEEAGNAPIAPVLQPDVSAPNQFAGTSPILYDHCACGDTAHFALIT